MNKELEEVIQNYNKLKKNKTVIANIDTEFFFKTVDTLLQALENSIPKETIEEKKTKLKTELIENGKLGWFSSNLEGKVQILEELLEGK